MRENSFVSVPSLSSLKETPNTPFTEMTLKAARWILWISLFAPLLDMGLRAILVMSQYMCVWNNLYFQQSDFFLFLELQMVLAEFIFNQPNFDFALIVGLYTTKKLFCC